MARILPRKRRNALYEGVNLGSWQLSKRIGQGGNADVYAALSNNRRAAVKILKKNHWGKKALARFKTEIEAMRRYSENSNVVPIFDADIPDEPTKANPPWFAMGLAEPIYDALGKEARLNDVINACAAFADVLSHMHKNNDAHRDIKPANLFRFEDQWAVGDFGLVQIDGKTSVTMAGDKIGAINYIAPEMLNDAYEKDGKPADVFSLAKTLWVLATGLKYPLPGQLQKNIEALRLSSYVSDFRSRSLESLLEACTSFHPDDRPAMSLVAAELHAWLRNPVKPISPTNVLDLSEFAAEIGAINEDHHIREKEHLDQNTFILSNQDRIMQYFGPLIEELSGALGAANFINVRMTEGGNSGTLFVAGHILATTWRGEVELFFDTHVSVAATGKTRLLCRYTAMVAEDGQTNHWPLWQLIKDFLAGGLDEPVQIAAALTESRTQFRPCVERVLQMSKGAEGSPPRKIEK